MSWSSLLLIHYAFWLLLYFVRQKSDYFYCHGLVSCSDFPLLNFNSTLHLLSPSILRLVPLHTVLPVPSRIIEYYVWFFSNYHWTSSAHVLKNCEWSCLDKISLQWLSSSSSLVSIIIIIITVPFLTVSGWDSVGWGMRRWTSELSASARVYWSYEVYFQKVV